MKTGTTESIQPTERGQKGAKLKKSLVGVTEDLHSELATIAFGCLRVERPFAHFGSQPAPSDLPFHLVNRRFTKDSKPTDGTQCSGF